MPAARRRARLALGVGLALAAFGLASAGAAAPDDQVLLGDSFLCTTPEGYDQALAAAAATTDLAGLRQQLLDQRRCMTVEEDDLEDMMAPFVKVLERQGTKVKVTYEVEFYKRIAMLHRNFARIRFAGWTGEDRLRLRSEMVDD